MAKYIETYCPKCGKVTTHRIHTEDDLGSSGASRIFSTIITLGFALLDCRTFSVCLSCGRKIEIEN